MRSSKQATLLIRQGHRWINTVVATAISTDCGDWLIDSIATRVGFLTVRGVTREVCVTRLSHIDTVVTCRGSCLRTLGSNTSIQYVNYGSQHTIWAQIPKGEDLCWRIGVLIFSVDLTLCRIIFTKVLCSKMTKDLSHDTCLCRQNLESTISTDLVLAVVKDINCRVKILILDSWSINHTSITTSLFLLFIIQLYDSL